MRKEKFCDREISWLAFNYRVLQEAKDTTVPLLEKIKFLAIFSSNLDEFFRVRVASLRSLLALKRKSKLKFEPSELLEEIHSIVDIQQEEFGRIFREIIIPELNKNDVYLVDDKQLSDKQSGFIKEYFDENILPDIQPMILEKDKISLFLKNRKLYLTIKLSLKDSKSDADKKRYKYALIEIPSEKHDRFIVLPKENGMTSIILLDDLIRHCMPDLFSGYNIEESFAVKLTRDAALDLGDEFSGNLKNKIEKGLKKRELGPPSRFLYDKNMPQDTVNYLRDSLKLTNEDLAPGGRYHNYHDFFSFPKDIFQVEEREKLQDEVFTPHRLNELSDLNNFFNVIYNEDVLLTFPYQSYEHVLDFFDLAARDEQVKSIKVTQYRVAKHSSIVQSLIRAAKNGKDVVVFVELKARFDEELNLKWANEMEKEGVKVYYSFPALKVHAKIALIERIENGETAKYSYLSTGNFNENNSKIYTDFGLFTSAKKITEEINSVFDALADKSKEYNFHNLLVAQFNMRQKFFELIDNEINNKKSGIEGSITLKLNSIEDRKMIKKLYQASNEGVEIIIICRGICCLVPGIEGQSENIKVISIVDRFLEHFRAYIFHNGGDELVYIGSADWMKRNLSKRIEVVFPIFDDNIKRKIKHIIEFQLSDNLKARIIDKDNNNNYKKDDEVGVFRSQEKIYKYLESE